MMVRVVVVGRGRRRDGNRQGTGRAAVKEAVHRAMMDLSGRARRGDRRSRAADGAGREGRRAGVQLRALRALDELEAGSRVETRPSVRMYVVLIMIHACLDGLLPLSYLFAVRGRIRFVVCPAVAFNGAVGVVDLAIGLAICRWR